MERLQKVMAHAGVDSRRKCEKLIIDGRVTVNGQTITELGFKVTKKDKIEVNGVPIYREHPVYLLLNKPKQVISAVKDDRGRIVVTDLVKEYSERIYPVGRLDYDTSGLILLTNDGAFANAMMHPKSKIDKVYIAKVKGIPNLQSLRRLERGIILDGRKTSPAKARMISQNIENQTAMIELTIHEGWNHQVKRMFEATGHPVMKLRRERFAFLNLNGLQSGAYRELTSNEIHKLMQLTKKYQ